MKYIYDKDGSIIFVQYGGDIYDGKGQFLSNVSIKDRDVYSGTEYVGYITLDTFHPSKNFLKNGINPEDF